MKTRTRRWVLITVSMFIIWLIAGFFAFQFAVHSLKAQIEKSLGPQSEVKEIKVGLTGVEIIGVRVRAPKNPDKYGAWPSEDRLRAERILITPSILDLLTAKMVLRGIRVEGAYISMLRAKDGQMHVLPGLLESSTPAASESGKSSAKEAGSVQPISIGKIELVNATIEFFDATIRNPPHKLRLEQINATIGKLQLPELKGFSTIDLVGIIKGVRQDGKLSISGQIEPATKESGLSTHLKGVDLVTLQPYLIKATESGVKKGTLDLDLKSNVHKGLLNAPGTLTLSNLELASSTSSGTIMGMPRNAAISMMKNKDGKISVKFVLEGNINDPHFSLNENLSTRIGTSVANTLGISIEGLAKGVGGVGSSTAKAIGDSFGKLLGK